jgi:hypothetical protein
MPAHPPPYGCMRLMIASKPPSHDAQLYVGHVALVQPALGSSVDLPSPIGLGCAAGCWSQLRTCVKVVVSLSVNPICFHLIRSAVIAGGHLTPTYQHCAACFLLSPSRAPHTDAELTPVSLRDQSDQSSAQGSNAAGGGSSGAAPRTDPATGLPIDKRSHPVARTSGTHFHLVCLHCPPLPPPPPTTTTTHMLSCPDSFNPLLPAPPPHMCTHTHNRVHA